MARKSKKQPTQDIDRESNEHHDALGRFTAGNKAGQHYMVRRFAQVRTLIHKSVTDEDVVEIVKTAVEQAKQGDGEARKWIFERLIGKPKDEAEAGETSQGWNIIINVADPKVKPIEVINVKPQE
jgi:hypothetical protein